MKSYILLAFIIGVQSIRIQGYPYHDDEAADTDDVTLSMTDLDNLVKDGGDTVTLETKAEE